MPYTGARRIAEKEWLAYRERRCLHLAEHPQYDSGWRRPSRRTAQAIWDLVASRMRSKGRTEPGLRIEDFLLPNYPWMSLEHDLSSAEHAMQALVVLLDAALGTGEGMSQDEEWDSDSGVTWRGEMLTANTLFDALAAHWSDHYRKAREETPATCAYEMREETLKASWRDLLRNGFRFSAIRDAILNGCPGLYKVEQRQRGYTVTIERDSSLWSDYRGVIEADGVYRRRRASIRGRVLIADDEPPPRRDRREVAAEWAYNVASTGERSRQVIDHLEGARLYLDTDAFRADLAFFEEKRRAVPPGTERTLVNELEGRLNSMQAVRDDLDDLRAAGKGPVDVPVTYPDVFNRFGAAKYLKIRSGHYKLMNRRYQAANFWPTEVTTRDSRDDVGVATDIRGVGDLVVWMSAASRGRWFRAPTDYQPDWIGDRLPLYSADVSASQIQILAVFLGLEQLETAVTERSLKTFLAERAWERSEDRADPFRLPSGFKGRDDPRLYAAVKTATMTHLYGSDLARVAFRLREPRNRAQFGPGLGDKANLARLLHDPQLHLQDVIGSKNVPGFLPACREVARIAYERDPYDGVRFVDPFDGAMVRWNPVRLQTDPKRRRWDSVAKEWKAAIGKRCVSSDGINVYANLPAGAPNDSGDYKVDRQKLARLVAPCLTHMLDAMFAGMVVEQLHARGVRTVVSVHDCWLVPFDERGQLDEALKAAGEPWLRALAPVYDALVGYLGDDETHGPWARQIRSAWQARVQAAKWPEFLTSGARLVEMKPVVTPLT